MVESRQEVERQRFRDSLRMFKEDTRQTRLREFRHMQRRDDGYIDQMMLKMKLPGRKEKKR